MRLKAICRLHYTSSTEQKIPQRLNKHHRLGILFRRHDDECARIKIRQVAARRASAHSTCEHNIKRRSSQYNCGYSPATRIKWPTGGGAGGVWGGRRARGTLTSLTSCSSRNGNARRDPTKYRLLSEDLKRKEVPASRPNTTTQAYVHCSTRQHVDFQNNARSAACPPLPPYACQHQIDD